MFCAGFFCIRKNFLTFFGFSLANHTLLYRYGAERGINTFQVIAALYKWADENKTTPKTSAPSIETAMNIMRPYIEAGREIICFSISGEMSTSGNVIQMAA